MKTLTLAEYPNFKPVIGRQTVPLVERYDWTALHSAATNPIIYEAGEDFTVKTPTFLRDVRIVIDQLGLGDTIMASRSRANIEDVVVGPRTGPKRTWKKKKKADAETAETPQSESPAADAGQESVDYPADGVL